MRDNTTQIVSQNNFNDIINIIEQSKNRALKAVNAEKRSCRRRGESLQTKTNSKSQPISRLTILLTTKKRRKSELLSHRFYSFL